MSLWGTFLFNPPPAASSPTLLHFIIILFALLSCKNYLCIWTLNWGTCFTDNFLSFWSLDFWFPASYILSQNPIWDYVTRYGYLERHGNGVLNAQWAKMYSKSRVKWTALSLSVCTSPTPLVLNTEHCALCTLPFMNTNKCCLQQPAQSPACWALWTPVLLLYIQCLMLF